MEKITKSIYSTAFWISIFVVFSKVLGLIKQVLIAYSFGATLETDAYFISSGVIISSSMVIFSAYAMSILPIYNDYSQMNKRKAEKFINNSLFAAFLMSVIIAFSLFTLSDSISRILSSSSDKHFLNLISSNIKLMSVVIVLTAYNVIINTVLEARGIFLPGKFYTFFQNSFIIIAIFVFSNNYGITSLLIAFIVSAIVQSIFITVKVFKYHKVSLPNEKWIIDLRTVLPLLVPLIIGNGIYQINDIIDKNVASGLANGYASYLNYGQSINEIVTVVIVGVITTILFSKFSVKFSMNEDEEARKLYTDSLNILIIILSFLTIISVIFSKEILTLIYFRGDFTTVDLEYTRQVMISYSLGYLFVGFRSISSKYFYASKEAKLPMINGIISVSINITFTIVLSFYFGIIGIGLATSLSMLFSSVFFMISMKKKYKFNFKSNLVTFYQCFIATLFSLTTYLIILKLTNIYLIRLILSIAVITGTYLLVLYILKNKAILTFIVYLKNKIKNLKGDIK